MNVFASVIYQIARSSEMQFQFSDSSQCIVFLPFFLVAMYNKNDFVEK